MKRFLGVLAAVLCLSAAAEYQVPQGWTTDINKAFAQAKKQNKKVFILFTGSDWCGYCKILKREVLDTNGFKSFARQKLVLLYVDFPKRSRIPADQLKKQQSFMQKYKITGFPGVIIADANGKEIGRKSGFLPKSGKSYLKWLKKTVK